MRHWIKTNAVFASEFEDIGIDQHINDRLSPFRFDLNEVVAYNESSTEGWATIWLMTTSITITMSVEKIDQLISQIEERYGKEH